MKNICVLKKYTKNASQLGGDEVTSVTVTSAVYKQVIRHGHESVEHDEFSKDTLDLRNFSPVLSTF